MLEKATYVYKKKKKKKATIQPEHFMLWVLFKT